MAEKKKAKKLAKKISKKVTKKPTKKTVRKKAKKVTKKVARKTKRATNKTAKKTTKKATKKVNKKVSKKAAKKSTQKKKATPKSKKKTKRKTQQKTSSKKADSRLEQLQDLLQENLSGIKTDKAEALAKNIWLAGMGAYSRTFNELADRKGKLKGRYAKINTEGQKVFEELVKRGDSMQSDLEKTMKKSRDSLESRFEDFKKHFDGGPSSFVDIPARLRDAAEKIEELSDKLKKK